MHHFCNRSKWRHWKGHHNDLYPATHAKKIMTQYGVFFARTKTNLKNGVEIYFFAFRKDVRKTNFCIFHRKCLRKWNRTDTFYQRSHALKACNWREPRTWRFCMYVCVSSDQKDCQGCVNTVRLIKPGDYSNIDPWGQDCVHCAYTGHFRHFTGLSLSGHRRHLWGQLKNFPFFICIFS